MSVAAALLLDAYRQLNARKLFWITLALSGLVMLVYLSIGFDETGMSMFFGLKHIESEFITSGSPIARILYRGMFSTFIVGIWLAWAATILALVSTATIFPDFIADGSVDLVLSKPVGRIRLFVLKYLTSLLFVLLQVGIFCVGVFVAMGWRLGDWNWLIFAAVPLVTLFYSYLYSISVLVGVVTRSALAALLITMLFWFMVFSLAATDGVLRQVMVQQEVEIEKAHEDEASFQERIDGLGDDPALAAQRQRLETMAEEERETAAAAQKVLDQLEPWNARSRMLTNVLPKTSETIGLLDRWLKEESDVNLLDVLSGNVEMNEGGAVAPASHSRDREVQQRLIDEIEGRSWWWVIGSSVAFELVVLAIACVVFVRRDY